MNPADEMAAKPDAAGSGEKSDQQLRANLENLQRVGHQGNPVEQDDLHSGIADRETSERKAIYDHLVAIENEMKRRGSRGFVRYLVAIFIGVAATLAWQSYGDAAKQIIATRAPELGWSPEAKQMIASWVKQLGWAKPPAAPENTAVRPSVPETPQAAPVAQTAPETVAPKTPAAPSLDPEQVHQIALDVAALRQNVEQLSASQNQMAREMARLQSDLVDMLVKIPEPPPQRRERR
jgi:hypothetical protein